MMDPTESASRSLLKGMIPALSAAWAVGAGAVVIGAWVISPDLAGSALLGGGIALVGTVAALAALAFALTIRGLEPAFAVLGASIFRAVAALFCGLFVQGASAAPDRPFWLSFLIVIGCVMAVEVAVSRRLLDRPSPKESPCP